MALMPNVSRMKKGFLNALAMGILLFLIIDVLSAAWQPTKLAAVAGYTGKGPVTDAVIDLLALFGGLGLGLLGLALYFFSSRRRHTRFDCDWSSDVCSSD